MKMVSPFHELCLKSRIEFIICSNEKIIGFHECGLLCLKKYYLDFHDPETIVPQRFFALDSYGNIKFDNCDRILPVDLYNEFEEMNKMALIHNFRLSGLLLTMIAFGTLILPGTASFMSDPYGNSCVFEGDQVEEALIQPQLSSQGEFCFIIDPDNLVMIGEYIQDTYPELWQQLSLEDQEYYNSVAAVWACGEDEPMLPNEIIRLLWRSQAITVSPMLHEQELLELTIAAQQSSAVPGLPSRFTIGNSRFAEMQTGSSLDVMSEVSNSIPNIQVLTGRSFSQANIADNVRMTRGISAVSPRIVTR